MTAIHWHDRWIVIVTMIVLLYYHGGSRHDIE